MFKITINKDIELQLCDLHHGEELFQLTIKNKEYLSPWLPWVPFITELESTLKYIRTSKQNWAEQKGLDCMIFYQGILCGVISLVNINYANFSIDIGYWLDKDHQGKGIMRICTQKLVDLAFNEYKLNRVIIRCAVNNQRSRHIPESLGFQNDGILRANEYIQGEPQDHLVFSLLKSDLSEKTS